MYFSLFLSFKQEVQTDDLDGFDEGKYYPKFRGYNWDNFFKLFPVDDVKVLGLRKPQKRDGTVTEIRIKSIKVKHHYDVNNNSKRAQSRIVAVKDKKTEAIPMDVTPPGTEVDNDKMGEALIENDQDYGQDDSNHGCDNPVMTIKTENQKDLSQ